MLSPRQGFFVFVPPQYASRRAPPPAWYIDALLRRDGQAIARTQAQERMFAKLANPRFLRDMRPLLPAAGAEALTEVSATESFRSVFTIHVDRLPGEPWSRTPVMKERFGISW